jgi:hypothetical protein
MVEVYMEITQEELQSIIDLMRYDPVLRRQFQLALEMDPLLALPARQDQFDERLTQKWWLTLRLRSVRLRRGWKVWRSG